MDNAEHQHFAWLARSFGRTDYLPLSPEDLHALSGAGEYVEKYPGTHLFREGSAATAAYVIQTGQVELYRARNQAWDDGTLVIGLAIDGEVKAYPVGFLNRREMVVDSIAGIPVLVTW